MSSLQGILPSFKINSKRFSDGWFATMTLHKLFHYLPRTSLISVGHLLDVHRYVFVILMRHKFNMLCRKHKFFATGETLLFLNYYYNYLRKYTQHKQKMHYYTHSSHNSRPFSQQVGIQHWILLFWLCFVFFFIHLFCCCLFFVMFAFLFTFYCFFKK